MGNLTELIESGKSANATQTEEERRAREAKEAELMTASELNEEVVTLRAKLKAAEDNFNRIEQENMSARQLAEELRTDVVKKQNEIIREKKEQDKLRKEIEGVTKETEDLEKKR